MEFRNVSRLLIYLSLSLFSPPVTIKSKVFDTKNKKKKGYIPSWDTSIAFYGYFCCSIIRLDSIAKQLLHARSHDSNRAVCCQNEAGGVIRNYGAREQCKGDAFALSSLPSRRLVGISIVGGTCRIRELRPMQRIPEYNQPRRGVISVYPVIIVQRESWSN